MNCAAEVVIATGTIEQLALFPNTDLPGVFLADGAMRLLQLYRLLPGRQVLVAGADDDGAGVACELARAGARVIVALGQQHEAASPNWQELRDRGVPLYLGHEIASALGRGHVSGATLTPVSRDGIADGQSTVTVQCDSIVVAGSQAPNDYLLGQTGKGLNGPVVPDSTHVALARQHIHLAG